jgi:hypothetical protein
MNAVVIQLLVPEDVVEEFEKRDRNILNVRVQLPSGEMVSGNNYRVEITLSRDAMLGLGTELIRSAYKGNTDDLFWHLHRATPTLASSILGVYLHPSSCELLISEQDYNTLQELLDEEQL